MQVTKPEDKTSLFKDVVQLAIRNFEQLFLEQPFDKSEYHIIMIGEFSRDVCNEVEKIYKEAGWVNVSCKTSSENGERPGLTMLQLTAPPSM